MKTLFFLTVAAILTATLPRQAFPGEALVYGVFRPVDLGNPGEIPQKDYYLNIGVAEGLRVGSTVEVLRKHATYDVLSQKLYQDLTFPIATLKIIHAEHNAAIARLEKLYPTDKTPAISPRAVMVGDLVRHMK